MLSDGTLRGIKPKATTYKIADRDGMYVTVSPRGTITFRLDYRLNGRRETLTIGRYGSKYGISLLMARERSMEARKAIAEGPRCRVQCEIVRGIGAPSPGTVGRTGEHMENATSLELSHTVLPIACQAKAGNLAVNAGKAGGERWWEERGFSRAETVVSIIV